MNKPWKNIIPALLVSIVTILTAQVNPGDVITTDLTLTADLDASAYAGPALTVGANNITIDGGGFTITVNGNNTAININGKQRIVIKNVTVVSSVAGQGRGVTITNTNDSKFAANTFSGLQNGIYTQGTNSRDTLSNNNMSGNTGSGLASHTYANNTDWVITNNNVTGSGSWAVAYRGRIKEISGNDFT
ncbi:MAG: hypothetical protein GXO90_11505, partial [FCB group bacterium]|nr:hypothetical protein [FCB group bacterium]